MQVLQGKWSNLIMVVAELALGQQGLDVNCERAPIQCVSLIVGIDMSFITRVQNLTCSAILNSGSRL